MTWQAQWKREGAEWLERGGMALKEGRVHKATGKLEVIGVGKWGREGEVGTGWEQLQESRSSRKEQVSYATSIYVWGGVRERRGSVSPVSIFYASVIPASPANRLGRVSTHQCMSLLEQERV